MMNKTTLHIVAAAVLLGGVAGCVEPGELDQSVVARYGRRLVELGPQQRQSQTDLGILRPVVGKAAPELKFETVEDDEGKQKKLLRLSMKDAVRLALANNPEIRVVSYEPAISREEMVRAAAEFDYVVFGDFTYTKEDVKIASFFPGGVSKEKSYFVGLRQKTVTGAEWALTWTMTRAWDNSTFYSLQPRYEPTLAFEITQPLLRDGWPEFNLANLRLARVNHKSTLQGFREKVEEILTAVIASYWQYQRTRDDYVIQFRLLAETIKTRNLVAARVNEGLAATLQLDQINASVKSRQAGLSFAKKALVDARDALAKLLADEQINILIDYEMVPSTVMPDAKLIRDMADQLLTALRHNPVLAQARLAIDAQAILVTVAENQTLPRLDLKATGGLQGLDDTHNASLHSLGTTDYASYSLGVSFEYPLGNRERLAELQRARYSRQQAVSALQNVADGVAQIVRERIRQVNTAFDQIKAFDEGIKAATDYRDKLEITISQELGEAMTPERLQLLLGAQELIANLQRGRLQAVTDYNIAIVELERAKGTVLEMNRVRLAMPPVPDEDVEPRPPAPQ